MYVRMYDVVLEIKLESRKCIHRQSSPLKRNDDDGKKREEKNKIKKDDK